MVEQRERPTPFEAANRSTGGATRSALHGLAAFAIAVGAAACASPPLDVSQAERVVMNKVYPYPSDEERAHAISKVAIRAASSAPIEDASPEAPLSDVKRQLDRLLRDSGASVVERGADYLLAAELIDYHYTSSWKKPTNWRLQSDDVMKQKPGTCQHLVEARLRVTVSNAPKASPLRSFVLERSAETETESLDPSCPFEPERREALLAGALIESLPCVRVPIANFFAPRGYLVERRRPVEGGYDVFRSTLTASQIPRDASSIGVYRVQLSTNEEGVRMREELQIAEGRIAPAAGTGSAAWVEVDLSSATHEPLDGDIVRPMVRDGGIGSLNPWNACQDTVVDGSARSS